MPQSPFNPVTVEGAALGRFLFYDTLLSSNGLSCASCHRQEFAFSDGPKRFSSGHKGQPTRRNSMPLFNLAWYPAFFWDGRVPTLEEQIFHPVRDSAEMRLSWSEATVRINNSPFYRQRFNTVFGTQAIDSTHIAKAIAQFLRTLLSYRSKYDRVLAGETILTAEEYLGFELVNDMSKGGCLHCHSTDNDALGTMREFSDIGLDPVDTYEGYPDKGLGSVTGKPRDNGKFKIPSLRNLAFTAPYMHDGRFNTLEDVLAFYGGGVQHSVNLDSKMPQSNTMVPFSTSETKAIIAFLKTLTDSAFVADKRFSNPFKIK